MGHRQACAATGIAQATWYRRHRQSAPAPRPVRARRPHPRALSVAERQAVADVLHSERFSDMAPAEVYATLLDDGVYLCSEATMYRILRERDEVRERRRQATHPPKPPPNTSPPYGTRSTAAHHSGSPLKPPTWTPTGRTGWTAPATAHPHALLTI